MGGPPKKLEVKRGVFKNLNTLNGGTLNNENKNSNLTNVNTTNQNIIFMGLTGLHDFLVRGLVFFSFVIILLSRVHI